MERFFAVFDGQLSYAILHGWQGLPEQLPSDLDIVVAPEELLKLERALLEMEGASLVNLLQHESTCFYFILAVRDGKQVRFLPVDAATDYRRDGRVWFSAGELLAGRRRWKNFWVAAPEVEFKYLLAKKILKGSVPPHAGRRLQELARELGSKANEEARCLLGKAWGAKVMDWLRMGDLEAFEVHLKALKQALKWERCKQDPLNAFRYWLPELRRIWQRWCYPSGLWVAVLGPDGAGKSTLIQGLEQELKGAFRRMATFHLMPGLLRRKGDGAPVTDPHGKPPRSLLTSLVKLVYYWLGNYFGYWLKIRPALVRSTLVLFDRYYDDLLIDPRRYRYGAPIGLARWFRRLIPRPDVFLVLDVPVEKLLERKQEVLREELERQVKAYQEFTFSTHNAFLIDGSVSPKEVVCQARDLLLDLLHERYLERRHIWFPEESSLFWLSEILGAEISPGGATHAYLNLPDGRGYLLPLDNGKIFRRALDLYPAQGKKARSGKVGLRWLSKIGMRGTGLPKVGLKEKENSIFQTLRHVFSRDDLVFGVSLGMPGPHRKPVIQVMTPEGEVLGYAKVGWNEETKRLVEHETQVLRNVAGESLPFRVPQVLYTDKDGDRSLCVQSPPPEPVQPAPRKLDVAYMKVLNALAAYNLCWLPLEESSFWQRLQERKERVRSVYWNRLLERAMEKTASYWKGRKVPFHLAHGDFTPWNAFRADGELYLYDWEYAMEEAPAGYDLFHFLFQVAWLVEKKTTVKGIIQMIINQCGEIQSLYKKHFGIRQKDCFQLFLLYLIDKLGSSYTEIQGNHIFVQLLEMDQVEVPYE